MILGIDIGGTNVKFGVCDKDYNIIEKYSIPTVKDKGDLAFVDSIAAKVNEIKKDFDIEKIGIGTPGTVDYEKGICVRAANVPYNDTPVAAILKEKTGIQSIKIANDATCAVNGELYAGYGKEFKHIAMITIGTGIGGGIIIDNKIYSGKTGAAGEFGHFTINYDGLPCPCGQKGCLEQYASVTALIRQTKEMIEKYPNSLLAKMGEKKVGGKTAFDAMKAGCEAGKMVVDRYTDYLTMGVLGIHFILQPQIVVIGGAISKEGDYIIKPIKEKLIRDVDVRVSNLGNDAGIIGAAAL